MVPLYCCHLGGANLTSLPMAPTYCGKLCIEKSSNSDFFKLAEIILRTMCFHKIIQKMGVNLLFTI